jgi:hypothetical protein
VVTFVEDVDFIAALFYGPTEALISKIFLDPSAHPSGTSNSSCASDEFFLLKSMCAFMPTKRFVLYRTFRITLVKPIEI